MTDVPNTHWARTADGACIAWQELGEGPVTLVIIHGWVSHLEIYWEQPRYVRFLRRLSRNMRVLVFDKRGVGMADRLTGPPGLDVQMDDVRAVMDGAGVERAAIFGWGFGGGALACMFAATHPARVLALCIDGEVAWNAGLAYDEPPDEDGAALARLVSVWGEDEHADEFVRQGFGQPDELLRDPTFIRWCGRFMRFAATPASYEAFQRMWDETDIQHVLASVHVPALVLGKETDVADPRWKKAFDYCLAHVAGARLMVVPGEEAVVWVEEPEPLVSIIEQFIATVRHEEAALDRMLATVLFTDLVGSTDKACEVGDARWSELLEGHNRTVRALLARYRGIEVKMTGDGFLATFDGPARAVKCAQSICEAMRPLDLQVRAGCHTGEIERVGADVGGVAVHIGARVGALAGPSEVLVTSTVKDLVAGSGFTFRDRGEHSLKGIPEPWHLYALATPSG